MADLDREEKQVKELATRKMNFHLQEARKWRLIVEAFEPNIQEDLFPNVKITSKPRIIVKANPKTLRERCEKTLNDMDTPLTSRDLKKEVEGRFNKKYAFNTFSGSFSQSYRAKRSLILKYDVPNPSLTVKSVYCLKSWYDDTEKLRKEYKQKIRKRYF